MVLSVLFSAKSYAYVIPKDLPTIEALIALHKAVKKDEDQALKRVATSFGEQSLVAKGAIKFNDVRTTLDTKLGNAHSYLVLAGAISSTANSLYQLVKEYKDFTGNTFKYVSKEAFCGLVLCGCQYSHIKGDKPLLQALCFRGSFGDQPDEGFNGRETESGDDPQNLHRQGTVHH